MKASVEAGGRARLQCSQVGRSSSMPRGKPAATRVTTGKTGLASTARRRAYQCTSGATPSVRLTRVEIAEQFAERDREDRLRQNQVHPELLVFVGHIFAHL